MGGGVFAIDFIENFSESKYFPIKFQPISEVCNMSDFTNLCRAIIFQKIIKVNYDNKLRTLKPYKLISHLSTWYLLATEDDIIKTFALYKLKSINICKDEFSHDKKVLEELENDNDFFTSCDRIEAILEVSGLKIEYFLNHKILANQKIINKTDDKLIISTMISYDDELLSVVFRFIPYVKILAPKELALESKKIVKEYLEYLK